MYKVQYQNDISLPPIPTSWRKENATRAPEEEIRGCVGGWRRVEIKTSSTYGVTISPTSHTQLKLHPPLLSLPSLPGTLQLLVLPTEQSNGVRWMCGFRLQSKSTRTSTNEQINKTLERIQYSSLYYATRCTGEAHALDTGTETSRFSSYCCWSSRLPLYRTWDSHPTPTPYGTGSETKYKRQDDVEHDSNHQHSRHNACTGPRSLQQTLHSQNRLCSPCTSKGP